MTLSGKPSSAALRTEDFPVSGSLTRDIQYNFVMLSGRVVDGNGVGVAGAELRTSKFWSGPEQGAAGNKETHSVSHNSGYTKTDADGNYQMLLFSTDVCITSGYYSSNPDDCLYDLTVIPPSGSGFAQVSLPSYPMANDKYLDVVLTYADADAPLILSGPHVGQITANAAVVTWQTSESATSVVAGNLSASLEELITEHAVPFTGLMPGSAYTIYVASTDASGNTVQSESVSFTTLPAEVVDDQPPGFKFGPVIQAITRTSAKVHWQTGEPATGVVHWGQGDSLEQSIVVSKLSQNQLVDLTGLTPGTRYAVQVDVTDALDNGPTVSPVISFTTLPAHQVDDQAPVIFSGPVVTDIAETEATVEWQTSEPATSGISWNDGTAFDLVTDEALSTRHSVRLTGLTPATRYYFTVSSKDAFGNGPTLSDEQSFVTLNEADILPPALVETPRVVGITHKSAVIQWRTDEKADSLVHYGTRENNPDRVEVEAKLKAQHTVQLTGLNKDTRYYFLVSSTDSAGNVSSSQEVLTFRTLKTGGNGKARFTMAPTVIESTNSSVTVAWQASEPVQVALDYTGSNGATWRANQMETASHGQLTLAGLESGANYNIALTATDLDGEQTDSTLSASTTGGVGLMGLMAMVSESLSEPVIDNVEILALTSSRVMIGWRTDVLTDSQVILENGRVAGDSILTRDHRVILGNLIPNTTYGYSIRSRSVEGAQSELSGLSFSTQADSTTPALVGEVNVSRDGSEAIISWETSDYTIGVVHYGQGDTLDYQLGKTEMTRQHQVIVTGLNPDNDYRFSTRSTELAGNELNTSVITSAGAGGGTGGGSDQDTDKDGLTDGEEAELGTDPVVADSDDDGLPDGWEVSYGLDPLDGGDAGGDLDNDGLTNADEYLLVTDPTDTDSDGDSMPDGWEVTYGFSPVHNSDAFDDDDGDGISNLDEYLAGTDPFSAGKTDNDFSGDGKADILLRHKTKGAWYLYQMDGRNRLGAGWINATRDPEWKVVSTDDFNGNGKADILLRHKTSGAWYMYQMDGRNRLDAGGLIATRNLEWKAVSTGDFNGDGKADILLRHKTKGAWYLYQMDGRNRLGAGWINATRDPEWKVVSTDDFDGNRKADILLRHKTSGAWYMYQMDGRKILDEGWVSATRDLEWEAVGTGDFSGDGKADILIRHKTKGGWYMYEMDGRNRLDAGGLIATRDLKWEAVNTGDFSGDGKADILLRHKTKGGWYMYQMDGRNRLGAGGVRAARELEWQPVKTP